MSLEYNTGGTAGLKFIDDIITLLNDNWLTTVGGKKPQFFKSWEFKESGLSEKYAIVIVHLDNEAARIFSMMQGDPTNNSAFSYDWLHEVSVSLEVRTGESERRVLELIDGVTAVLKKNVVPILNNRQYIQIIPDGYVPMNEDYRNIFKSILSCTAQRFNP